MTAVGLAAALDDAAADREHAETLGVKRDYARLLCLLRLCRFALGPADAVLAGQIDAELLGRVKDHEDGEPELVWERLPSGEFTWLRPERHAA